MIHDSNQNIPWLEAEGSEDKGEFAGGPTTEVKMEEGGQTSKLHNLYPQRLPPIGTPNKPPYVPFSNALHAATDEGFLKRPAFGGKAFSKVPTSFLERRSKVQPESCSLTANEKNQVKIVEEDAAFLHPLAEQVNRRSSPHRPASRDVVEFYENPLEKRGRRRSHLVIYVTTFVTSIGFSIVLTGLWPYLQEVDPMSSKEFLGWVVAVNPLGQMIVSPLIGFWESKTGSCRIAFMTTMVMYIVGNIMYSFVYLCGSLAKVVLLLSRFIVGVSSANMTLCRSYIASSTTEKERTTALSNTAAAQALGLIIGPVLQTLLAVYHSSEEDTQEPSGSQNSSLTEEASVAANSPENPLVEPMERTSDLRVYTDAGWIAVGLGVVTLAMFFPCIFKEYNITQRRRSHNSDDSQQRREKSPKLDYAALTSVLFAFCIISLIYVLLETIVVPMCIDLYAWSPEFAIKVVGIGLSIAGVLAMFVFFLSSYLSKKFDERKVYIFMGLIPTTMALLIHFPMGNNYPILKDCEILAPPDILSTATTEEYLLSVEPVTSIQSSAEVLGVTSSSDVNMNLLTTLPAFVIPNSTLHADDSSLVPGNRRKRTALSQNRTCSDLGCPVEQEWCSYTPIVELSQMAIADLFAVIGYPCSFAISSAIFSKMLGPKPQGFWMGILTSAGSFSRMAGPIFVTYMYTELGTRWTFGSLFVSMLVTLAVTAYFYRRIAPLRTITQASENITN